MTLLASVNSRRAGALVYKIIFLFLFCNDQLQEFFTLAIRRFKKTRTFNLIISENSNLQSLVIDMEKVTTALAHCVLTEDLLLEQYFYVAMLEILLHV